MKLKKRGSNINSNLEPRKRKVVSKPPQVPFTYNLSSIHPRKGVCEK